MGAGALTRRLPPNGPPGGPFAFPLPENPMRSIVLLLLLPLFLLLPGAASAQQASPVGTWRTIDDATGKPKSIVRIYATDDGTLQARVLQVLDPEKGPNPLCDACKGRNHNRPVVGMVIAWGLRRDGSRWDDGRIMDPGNGKVYSARMTPGADGKTLEVRGYIGMPMLGRTQVWQRE
jgi:uncharacterized protein (DUF2147 family)